MGTWLCSQTNCVSKILTFEPQGFNPINVWNSYCTKAVGNHRVSMNIRPFVVNLEHFSRVCIIIDHHPCITNDGYTTNFTGMEPADMDMCSHPICKLKIEMGNIVDIPLEMCMRLHLNLFRFLTNQVEDN